VRDAETKQPIASADVNIWYAFIHDACRPQDSRAQTAADGIAHLRAGAYRCDGVMVEAAAKDYLSEQIGVPVDLLDKIEPASPFKTNDLQPVSLVVELYAAPHPTIELIVPTGYRGLVKVELEAQSDAKITPGQRTFRYEVQGSAEDANLPPFLGYRPTPPAVVKVQGPLLFKHLVSADYRGRFADGTEMKPDKLGVMDVGLRWLRCAGSDQFFVVGTQSDFDRVRRSQSFEEGQGRKRRRATQDP
jgi:hypothetical protein